MADFSTNNKEPQNCWEYWDCPQDSKETCKVYAAQAGRMCWYLAENFRPVMDRDFESCEDCPWLKKLQS